MASAGTLATFVTSYTLFDAALAVHPAAALASFHGNVRLLEQVVESATGWLGLLVIFTYSFLIAVVLPGPSEIVLATPLDIGFPYAVELAIIILVSSVGKAAGSVVAFKLGRGVKQSGPVVSRLRRSRFEVVEWSERRTVEIAKRWGYVGLALALCVPLFPDTISVYAFAVIEEDDLKFALATFAGSVGRLLLVLGAVGGALSIL